MIADVCSGAPAFARAASLAVTLAAVIDCGGASPAIGLDAHFRASGAQLVEAPLQESVDATGPQVHSIGSNNNRLYPGVQNKAISGTVEARVGAVAIGLAGDSGYWIVPSGSEDQMNPPDLTFSTRGSFSPDLGPATYQLIFRAIDSGGRMGPSKTETLTLAASPVQGTFVISLEWGGPADLDLHVVAPATGTPESKPAETVEIWSKKRNSLSSSRGLADGPFTPDVIAAAGILDFDSNSGCVNDGRDNENVVWSQPPPSGHYVVRVDAASLCGAAATVWRVTAYYNEQLVGDASGQFGDTATVTPHIAGAGLKVLELNVM